MAASPEQKKQYSVIKTFKGLNTKANRTAIDESEFAWIENIQPIGNGNLSVVPTFSYPQASGANVTFANTVTSFTSFNVNNIDYITAFESDGRAEYYNLNSSSKANLAVSGTFSGTGVRAKQWKNERALILDPSKGFYTWNGTNLISVGSVSQIGITNGGTGYTSIPNVTISAPNETNGVQAQAVAVISNAAGTITGVQINNVGTGYVSVPIVTIAPPTSIFGTQAQAVATIAGGNVVAISVTNPGLGYTTTPSVSITGTDGSGASASALVGSGLVTSIVITEAGSGYTSEPTVTISGGGGSNATAKAGYLTFRTGSIGVILQDGGSGYTTAPTVGFSGGGGSGAAATAIVAGGVVVDVIVTNPGTGYTSNPTVTFTSGSGSGAAARAVATVDNNVDIASFQGRVWIAQGRTLFYSAAGTYNDFISVSAGNITLDDDTLHTVIKGIVSANNFLYVFGEDSINTISDVRVSNNGSTLFTNTNVSASIGSRRVNTVFPYFRNLLFMNDYGIYALIGATTTKLSDALDGIFPLIDFSYPVTGGQVIINNILCACFNFYYNDPVNGLRPIQAVFFDKKWFITTQGTVNYTTSVSTATGINIYAVGTSDRILRKFYSDANTPVSFQLKTALMAFGDAIRDKQALKFGVESTSSRGGTFSVTVDSEYNSSPATTFGNYVDWINNSSEVVLWTNNSSAAVDWLSGFGYTLYKSDAQQYGKYLGLTLSSSSISGVTFNTFEWEYELRARF